MHLGKDNRDGIENFTDSVLGHKQEAVMQLHQIDTEPFPASRRRLKNGHIVIQGGRFFDWTLIHTSL